MSNTPDNSPPSDSTTPSHPLDHAHHPASRPVSLLCEVLIDQRGHSPATAARLKSAVVAAARYRGCCVGEIGVRVTDDRSIREINRDHLGHDYATDVISFGYSLDPPHVEGELVVSGETARREAARLGWPDEHELLLYAVHGTLHITGMDDQDPSSRQQMRVAEQAVLTALNISGIERFGADSQSSSEPEGSGPFGSQATSGPGTSEPGASGPGERSR